MSLQTRTALEAYFENGDKPTQAQFAELIESLPNKKDDLIAANVENISGLIGISITDLSNYSIAVVSGYYSAGDGGGGTFYWDANEDKANHNGITVFSPTWANGTFGDTQDPNWYAADPADTGSGVWTRNLGNKIRPEYAGAKGDGVTDDFVAFDALKEFGVSSVKVSFSSYFSTNIELTDGKTYVIGQPIHIPGGKNITIDCGGLMGASIKYTGTGDFVFIKEEGSNGVQFKVNNIFFEGGGIRVVGASRGMIRIKNNTFLNTTGSGVQLIDNDLIGGSGFGVVHWVIEENEFHGCNRAVEVISDTILVGRIQKNRFNKSTLAPVYIDGTGIIIENNEFQGMSTDNPQEPYIHFSGFNFVTAHNKVINNRFGTETFTGYDAPANTVIIGDKTTVNANDVNGNPRVFLNIIFNKNLFFSNQNPSSTTGDVGILMNSPVGDMHVTDGNQFREYNTALIKEAWWEVSSPPIAPTGINIFKNNNLPFTADSTIFSSGGAGWIGDYYKVGSMQNNGSVLNPPNLIFDPVNITNWTSVNTTVTPIADGPSGVSANGSAYEVKSDGSSTPSVYTETNATEGDKPFTVHLAMRAGSTNKAGVEVSGVTTGRVIRSKFALITLDREWGFYNFHFPALSSMQEKVRVRVFINRGVVSTQETIEIAWAGFYRGRLLPDIPLHGPIPSRTNAGNPDSVIIPLYIGEELLDTTNNNWYKAVSTANTGWKLIT